MKLNFLKTIQNSLRTPLFTDDDLKLIFQDKRSSSIYNSLTYHLSRNNLERYKRGLYSFPPRKGGALSFSKFKLANKLVLQSYISFESALSYHCLIPEAVYETTSACFVKNKIFENKLGRFSFRYSPVDPFYLGVEKDEITDAKVANPIRALFDLIYVRRKHYSKATDLEIDFRIDLSELKKFLNKFEASDILKLGELYKKRTTKNLANILVRDLM